MGTLTACRVPCLNPQLSPGPFHLVYSGEKNAESCILARAHSQTSNRKREEGEPDDWLLQITILNQLIYPPVDAHCKQNPNKTRVHIYSKKSIFPLPVKDKSKSKMQFLNYDLIYQGALCGKSNSPLVKGHSKTKTKIMWAMIPPQ